MSLFNPNGLPHGDPSIPRPPEAESPKANQACLTCKKQKRKCSKALPRCALCERMNRPCDYSDASPLPTSEDFNALRVKLLELESKFHGGNNLGSPSGSYAAQASGALAEQHGFGAGPSYNVSPEMWHAVPNRFPVTAFLDGVSFRNGGYVHIVDVLRSCC